MSYLPPIISVHAAITEYPPNDPPKRAINITATQMVNPSRYTKTHKVYHNTQLLVAGTDYGTNLDANGDVTSIVMELPTPNTTGALIYHFKAVDTLGGYPDKTEDVTFGL